MSLEKIFQRESSGFQCVSVGLFGFLYGVSEAVYFRFVVRFNMVCGVVSLWTSDTFALTGCEENFRKKKNGSNALKHLLACCERCFSRKLCGHRRKSILADINDLCAAGRLKQWNLNTQMQSVCSRCEVSGVINFRLGSVITSPSVFVLAALWFGKN